MQTPLEHLVETDAVDEEASVDAVYLVVGDACVRQREPVYVVPGDWVLVLWFEHHTRYVQVLSIQQSLIDPSFNHLRIQLYRVFS